MFTFLVDCSADGGAAVAHHKNAEHHRDGLSAKLLTHEELEHHVAAQSKNKSPHKAHATGKASGHRNSAPPKVIDDSEW